MDWLKRTLQALLNPSSRLDRLPGLSTPHEPVPTMEAEAPAGARGRLGWRDILFNFPLVFGGLIVAALFLVVLFGPIWAPVNPYIGGERIRAHFDPASDAWISPPLEPNTQYLLGTDEWGNDILSMLLYGARNTLVACAFITMVRLILGLILGAYAGWNPQGLTDQVIMGTISIVSSVPILISSILLIYALDIRRGLPVFIVALAVIGWTEIAQYIRSEFLVLRKMPYIEGARAVGARGFAVAVRHVLPNLLPQLLIITFLEMGAVLMLLGELGFVGIYIGGGSRIALGDEITGIQVMTLAEVPEWGAMLAEGYRWLRAKPFIVFPPAMAFFVAVVGLNIFGEGLRRLVEKNSLDTNFLLRKRMVLVMVGLTAATIFILNNTGPAPWFNRVAQSFDGRSALQSVRELVGMKGRGVGQDGGHQAAEYIAGKFEEYGLQPGWRHGSYLYPLPARLVQPLAQPEMALVDADGHMLKAFRHRLDFGFMTEGHAGSGQAEAPLTFVGFNGGSRPLEWEDYQGLDLRGQIALVVRGNAPADFATEALIRGASGVLWMTGDGQYDVSSQIRLSDAGESLVSPTLPVFRIRPAVAQKLLDAEDILVDELLSPDSPIESQGTGWYTRDLGARVRMSLSLDEIQETEIPAVLGFLPGSDFDLAHEMVVLFANYDGLGTEPDGTVYPSANDNASGVGVLLEMARLWQEQELNPRRSVMFVAWGGGQLENSGALEFLQNSRSFRHLPNASTGTELLPEVVFQVEESGAGGSELFIHPASNHRLLKLVEDSAQQAGIDSIAEDSAEVAGRHLLRTDRAAWVYFTWADAAASPEEDRLERIEAEKLQIMGETLSLALTHIVRESSY